MFPAEKKGEWEPLRVREKRSTKTTPVKANGTGGHVNGDVTMSDGVVTANGQDPVDDEEEDIQYEEDPTSEEGAVYPMQNGKVVDWPCFFALLTHVYNTLSPPFHTPILVISQPTWTAQDHEILTQFFFEKFKTPAFCLMDSAMAVCYAFNTPTATVVDVGLGKCDVTAVSDFVLNENGRTAALPSSGGEAMTERLLALLGNKGFTREMSEQLKKNPICEVLPEGSERPADVPEEPVANPAQAASTGAAGPGEGQRGSIASQGGLPRGPGPNTDAGDADQEREVQDGEDDDGVLDVATIVASGKTSEFLARKEREKAEKATAKKIAADAAAASKIAKLPNSRRAKATFQYHERKPMDELNGISKQTVDGDAATVASKPPDTVHEGGPEAADAATITRKEERREERRRHREGTAYIRKEIEIGLERFEAASGGILDRIADSIHRCVLSVPEVNKRSELWDSLIILGNGSKVKGNI